ncbi:3'-5' exonuclease [Komagataeibacter xylinus]|uniref:3'-5' exonuclease n=1 Tax=Komagataeibacter xylinus TaxID=28448 RepID=UPI000FDF9E8F|nr:3'-5' exonuclease [Komagataeibacter xylinus]AZV39038.1 DNA helicase [Komagataeibacter xylinus]
MTEFRIADTFTASLTRLSGQEQKAAKITALDLQLDPIGKGLSFHRIDRAKDPHFWSVRVNRDIRQIVHRMAGSLMLVWVDHHDDAYRWAERRRIEVHPATGAMQMVEIRERVEELPVPVLREKRLFAGRTEAELLSFGVPADWLADVLAVTDEDALLDLLPHLPGEAAEALMALAVGEKPAPARIEKEVQGFAHPDAQRRFRVLHGVEELRRALDYPWDKWAIFLHPAQQTLVDRSFSGAARVMGSAGTGKTIVALHRAVHLAQVHPNDRVLLTTFSAPLARALATRLSLLASDDISLASRIDVGCLMQTGLGLYANLTGKKPLIASLADIQERLAQIANDAADSRFSLSFLFGEWSDVVDARQIRDWETYRTASRLGRKARLGEKQRASLWTCFEALRKSLAQDGLITVADVFLALTDALQEGRLAPPYGFVIVDEAQDLDIAEARFLSALAGRKENGLFFAGDLGQRIFQQPFSWKAMGIDVRGRSSTLKINYRTSHQIRTHADRLLSRSVSDADGIADERAETVSLFDGPTPIVALFDDAKTEEAEAGRWIAERMKEGCLPEETAVLVRSRSEINRAKAAVRAARITATILDDTLVLTPGSVSILPMHLAKGLEFRVVVVMACDDEVIPLQSRIEQVADEGELEEVYATERHLLYVACTRARDALWVSGVKPGSEFLDDLESLK